MDVVIFWFYIFLLDLENGLIKLYIYNLDEFEWIDLLNV